MKHYNHIANEKTSARRDEYVVWINSHTPEQIRQANTARTQLRKIYKDDIADNKSHKYTTRLHDDRTPKRVSSGFPIFVKARHDSGDLKGIKPTDAMTLIANEWRALSTGEKQVCLRRRPVPCPK